MCPCGYTTVAAEDQSTAPVMQHGERLRHSRGSGRRGEKNEEREREGVGGGGG